MARTIDYWYQQIITQKNNTPELSGLTSTSKTANFSLWAFIVAVAIAALDNLFDLHKSNVDDELATLKPHGLKWYRDLALRFQYGQELIADSDQYANTGLTTEQIAAQKIITQAAVTEIDGKLRLKVVKLVNDDYAQLSTDEMTALLAYVASTKDAGVKVTTDSLPPDSLKLSIDVFYNPLVLKGDGSRIDGEVQTPVPDAIATYLKNLLFNGEYSNMRLVDQLQQVDGVALATIKLSQAKYGLFPFSNIDEVYIPDAGYLRIATGDLTINYRQYVQY
ncbi:hypothetical protein ACCC92_24235 [Mucilaginibacter sp. Mucisp84]|uniref:hypothetical protein n=1 Tax=Mucilaginibacter sp. Mucisp84 TaxID=3243058 RepID=UPI0039A5A75D